MNNSRKEDAKADEDMAVYSKATAVYSKALAIYDSTNASFVYAAKDAKAAKDAAYATFIAAEEDDD